MNTSNSTLVEADRQNLKKRDERLFQVLFLISFPIFLVIVLATRLVPAASDAKKAADGDPRRTGFVRCCTELSKDDSELREGGFVCRNKVNPCRDFPLRKQERFTVCLSPVW